MDINRVNLISGNNMITSKNTQEIKTEKEFSEILNEKIENDKKLMEACEMLESFFIKEILKSADNVSFTENTMFAEGSAEKTFKDMLNNEYSQMMSRGKGMGIAEMLYKQLKKE